MISTGFHGAHNQKQIFACIVLVVRVHIFFISKPRYIYSQVCTSKLDRFNSNKKAMQSFKYMQEPQTTAINLYCTLHCQLL